MPNASVGKRRRLLEFVACCGFVVWLFLYAHLDWQMLQSFAHGSDIMLMMVLAGLHGMISLGILAGARRFYQLIWALGNTALIAFLGYAMVQWQSGAGSIVMNLIGILMAVIFYIPCLWFVRYDPQQGSSQISGGIE